MVLLPLGDLEFGRASILQRKGAKTGRCWSIDPDEVAR